MELASLWSITAFIANCSISKYIWTLIESHISHLSLFSELFFYLNFLDIFISKGYLLSYPISHQRAFKSVNLVNDHDHVTDISENMEGYHCGTSLETIGGN